MKKIYWGLFLLLTFLVTLPASWWIMSKANFFYSPLYDLIGIDAHIERYAPKNMLGHLDFEKTSKAQRVELFHGIVVAINHHGEGLEKLFYHDANQQRQPLLTRAEVQHLQDVANLLNKLKPLMAGLFIIWLFIVALIIYKKQPLATAKEFFVSTLVILCVFALVLLIGPEKVFNQLHMWVFPDNHQWFFYYEESLMSTMMKAPDLFGYIAAIWVFFSILITAFLIFALKKLI